MTHRAFQLRGIEKSFVSPSVEQRPARGHHQRNHDGEKHPAVNHMIEADSEIHAGPVRNIDGAEGANAIGHNRSDQRPGKEDYAARPTLEAQIGNRSEEHTSELQSLMSISYAYF